MTATIHFLYFYVLPPFLLVMLGIIVYFLNFRQSYLDTIRQEFLKILESSKKQSQEILDKHDKRLDETLSDTAKKAKEHLQSIEAEATTHLSNLNEKMQEFEEIIDSIIDEQKRLNMKLVELQNSIKMRDDIIHRKTNQIDRLKNEIKGLKNVE